MQRHGADQHGGAAADSGDLHGVVRAGAGGHPGLQTHALAPARHLRRQQPRQVRGDGWGALAQMSPRSLVSCVRLLGSGPMLRLSLAFLYTGLEISYWAGVLPACVSFTRALGPGRKGMMGLASILVSCGSMAGGLLLILCKQGDSAQRKGENRQPGTGIVLVVVTSRGRTPVVMLGLATHLAAYTLSLVSLPHLSPLGDTQQVTNQRPPAGHVTSVLISDW